ncbi:MAG: nucleotidyltransferase family protein [Thiohalocapsa sp.]
MSLLLVVIQQPCAIRQFITADWNCLMQEVRDQKLGARLGWLWQDQGLLDSCPGSVRNELMARRFLPEFIQAQTRFELRKLRKALASSAAPILLLKGAAYMVSQLPLARGRTFSDLDVLVPRERLDEVENLLRTKGWETKNLEPYDQRYYRRWMHEIPPLRHKERNIEIDIHHAILPLTSRLQPSSDLLWDDSQLVADSNLRVLSPRDMVLHAAAHCFHDGEIKGALSQVIDIHELLLDFGVEDGFWPALLERAEQLQLGRPLYYALTTSSALLGTPVPSVVQREARRFAPNPVTDYMMQRLLRSGLEPRWPARREAYLAAWLLYVRSHWLRMPPGLLGAHLGRKAWRRALSPPTNA